MVYVNLLTQKSRVIVDVGKETATIGDPHHHTLK